MRGTLTKIDETLDPNLRYSVRLGVITDDGLFVEWDADRKEDWMTYGQRIDLVGLGL